MERCWPGFLTPTHPPAPPQPRRASPLHPGVPQYPLRTRNSSFLGENCTVGGCRANRQRGSLCSGGLAQAGARRRPRGLVRTWSPAHGRARGPGGPRAVGRDTGPRGRRDPRPATQRSRPRTSAPCSRGHRPVPSRRAGGQREQRKRSWELPERVPLVLRPLAASSVDGQCFKEIPLLLFIYLFFFLLFKFCLKMAALQGCQNFH